MQYNFASHICFLKYTFLRHIFHMVKIYSLQVYDSVIFTNFIQWCKHHHKSVLEHFLHSNKTPHAYLPPSCGHVWMWELDPSPGDLPSPGIEPLSPALEADALTSEPPGKEDFKVNSIAFACFCFSFPSPVRQIWIRVATIDAKSVLTVFLLGVLLFLACKSVFNPFWVYISVWGVKMF